MYDDIYATIHALREKVMQAEVDASQVKTDLQTVLNYLAATDSDGESVPANIHKIILKYEQQAKAAPQGA